MRLSAPLLAVLPIAVLAGCGGHGHAQPTTTAARARPSAKVAVVGTSQSAAAVAAEASQPPTGDGPPPDLQPVSARAFRRPVAAYLRYAGGQLAVMQGQVAALTSRLASDDRAGARAEWRNAFASYIRVGAAYGSFGKLDQEIDGTAGGLPGGVHDPGFTGLHRIEYGLWTGARPAGLVPAARRLARDVRRLRARVPHMAIDPLDYATRAHEILEDAQRDLMSGDVVPWSRDGVLGTAAALSATREVIGTLRSVLAGRGGALEPVQAGVLRLGKTLDAIRRAHHGDWPTLDHLSAPERERLDGSLGAALESLSAVPDALATSKLPVIPTLPHPG